MFQTIKDLFGQAKKKAGELADKALQATPDLVKKMSIGIRSWDEFETAKKAKRFVAVFGKRTDLNFQKVLALLPVYSTKAWISGTTLRSVEIEDYTDFIKSLDLAEGINLHYYKDGVLIENKVGETAVNEFLWKIHSL